MEWLTALVFFTKNTLNSAIDNIIYKCNGLLEDVIKEVASRGRVLRLLLLHNHKNYNGFVDSLEYELREELVESLILEML